MASAGSQVTELAQKLYDACLENYDTDRLFNQADLLGLGVIPEGDVALLLQCAQSLVDQKLFRLHQDRNDRLSWKVISQEDAEKLQSLSPDESLVYNVIHSTQRSGVWVRSILQRTGLHKSITDRCLKSLESKGYIKSIHNVKYPTRKVYMLAGLVPAEDVSGGAWFTDGVLDANFINSVALYIEFTVSRKSWYEVPADRARAKRQKTATGKVDTAEKTYLPYPADYTGYPSVETITSAINESGLTPVRLDEAKVVELLQMLCYDKKLVELEDGRFYKSIRNPEVLKAIQARKQGGEAEEPAPPKDTAKLSGLNEHPCGHCPSFDLCYAGGAVSAETCEYFDPWTEKNFTF